MWLNLNGQWEFRFDPLNIGQLEGWQQPTTPFDREVNVPFCWESPLSGIGDTSGQQVAWYRRDLSVPSEWDGHRVWLRFEAVARDATVWVNGTQAGTHAVDSGPFAFDITEQAPPGKTTQVVVRVHAPTSSGTSIEHTGASGIWQTVWLEARPETYVDSVSMTPRRENDAWVVDLAADLRGPDGPAAVSIRSPDSGVETVQGQASIENGVGEFQTTLTVESPRPWTPSAPELYDLEIEVTPGSGVPDIVHTYFALRTVEVAGAGARTFLLNAEPVSMRCAKDYSRNPEGIATAPDDEFLRRDLELTASLGVNCLSVRAADLEPRKQWWADRLGVLLVGDSLLGEQSGADASLLSGGGDRDISWNVRAWMNLARRQGWGLLGVRVALADFEFEHDGLFNYDRTPKEFGYAAFVERMTLADLLGDDFVGFETPPVIVTEPGAAVSVPIFVSHFSDRDGEIMVHPWLVGIDDLGAEVRVDLDFRPVTWELFGVTQQRPLGVTLPAERGFVGALAMELLADGERIGANFVNIIAVRPRQEGVAAGSAESAGPRRVAFRRSPLDPARVHWSGAGVPSVDAQRQSGLEKLYFRGPGSVEYRFPVPDAVLEAGPIRVGLLLELGTKARDEKLDWARLANPLDYPQTDGRKLPGAVQIHINGEYLDPIALADDPADSRGVLSHMTGVQHGSYGYLVRGELVLQGLAALTAQLRRNPEIRVVIEVLEGESANGLSVYGARSGLYPIDPTIVIETQRDIVWE